MCRFEAGTRLEYMRYQLEFLGSIAVRHTCNGACSVLLRRHNAFVEEDLIGGLRFDLIDLPEKTFWEKLPFGVRMAVGACGPLLAIAAIGTGVATVAASLETKPHQTTAKNVAPHSDVEPTGNAIGGYATGDVKDAESARPVPAQVTAKGGFKAETRPRLNNSTTEGATSRDSSVASQVAESPLAVRANARPVRPHPATTVSAPPVITTHEESEVQQIPYTTRFVHDPGLVRGVQLVQFAGVVGERSLRYLVTLTNGRQTGRRLLSSTVTRQPQQRVVVLGDQSSDRDDDRGFGTGSDWGPGIWQGRHKGDEYRLSDVKRS
jgi:surface rod structure-forming protein G